MAAMSSAVEVFRGTRSAQGFLSAKWTWTVYVLGEAHTITIRRGVSGVKQVVCDTTSVTDVFGIHGAVFRVKPTAGSFGNSYELIVNNTRFKDLPHISTPRYLPPASAAPVVVENYRWNNLHFAPGNPGKAHKVIIRCTVDNTTTWAKVQGSSLTLAESMKSEVNMAPFRNEEHDTWTTGTSSTNSLTHATRKAVDREIPFEGLAGHSLAVYSLVLLLRVPASGEVVEYETPIIDSTSDGTLPAMVPARQLRITLGMM